MALTKKIRVVGTSLVITIPKSIADLLEWKQGNMVEIQLNTTEEILTISKKR